MITSARLRAAPKRLITRLRHTTTEQRNIHNVFVDGFGVGLVLGIGSFLSVFLVRLGASSSLIGLLTAMPALTGMFLAIPVGRLLERQRRIVPWYALSRLLALLPYALTGLVPFFFQSHQPEIIIVIWALATFPQTIVSVAFNVVMGGAVQPGRRMVLMSWRWSVLGFTNAITAAIVGQVLYRLPFPLGYQVVFLFSLVGVLISFTFASRIILPESTAVPMARLRRRPLGERLRRWGLLLREQRAFTHFVVGQFVFTWGTAWALPLFPLYWVRDLGISDAWVGLINTARVTVLVAYFLWLRLSERRGERFVLLVATLGGSLYPLLTALTGQPEWLAAYSGLNGVFMAGANLVRFDILLNTAPPERRPTYMALNQTTVNLATFAAPIISVATSDIVGIGPALMLGSLLSLAGFALFAGLGVGRD